MLDFNTDEAHVTGILLKKTLKLPISAENRCNLYQKLTKDRAMDYAMFEMVISALEFKRRPEMSTKELFSKVDLRGDGVLHEDEFSFLIQILSFPVVIEKENFSCADLFELFDWKMTGSISKDEFDNFFNVVGATGKISKSNLNALFQQVDTAGSGSISFEEWVHGMFNKQLYLILGFSGDRIQLTRREFQILYCANGDNDIYEANMKFFEIDLKQNGFIDLGEIKNYCDALDGRSDWQNFIFTGDFVLIIMIIIFVLALGKETIAEPNLVDIMEVLIGCAEIYFFAKLSTQEIIGYREDLEILQYIVKSLGHTMRVQIL
jgi:Ca2+-binding EF-hand superfamily protein